MTDPSTGKPDSARPRVGIARGTFLGLRADVVTVISAVLVSIVVSRGLGPENRGVFFLAFAAALLIAMVGDFGMSTAGITYAASGEVAPGELHGAALGFSFVVGALAALALLPAHEFWTSEVLKGLDSTMLLLLCAAIPPLIYAQVLLATLAGLGRIPAISWIRIAQQIAIPAFLLPAVLISGSPQWTFAAWLATAVGNAVAIGIYTVRTVSPPSRPARETVRKVLSFGTRGWVGTISHHGFLASTCSSWARVGSCRRSASTPCPRCSPSASRCSDRRSTARLRSRVGGDEREEAARLVAQIVRSLLLLLVPVAAIAALLAFPGIPLVFGDDFADAALPFALLLPGTVCLTLWYPVSLFIIANLRRPGTTTLIQGGALLASLPLYYLMIGEFDMTGAAVASSLVYVSVLLMGIGVLVRATGVRPGDLVPRLADSRRLLVVARSAVGHTRG